MFCVNCGTKLPDAARFCPSCGTSLSAASPSPALSPSPTPVSPPTYSPSPANGSHSPAPASTMLLSPQGHPQPAFQRLAGALFDALDRSFQLKPHNTRGLEVSKMEQYRLLGGLTNPPFYGEYVLPTYCSVIGIDIVPNQPQTAPVISWQGWHQFLAQKILLEPEQTCFHLNNLCRALALPISLNRADFPAFPDPQARAKENQFRQAIQALVRKSLAAQRGGGGFNWGGFNGGSGFGGGGGGGAAGGSGSGTMSSFLQFGTAMLNSGMFGGLGGGG